MSAAPVVDRVGEVRAAGDHRRVGVRPVPAAEQPAAHLAVRPGDRVLDVAGGTGDAALAAARRDGDVVCGDVVPRAGLEGDSADREGRSTRGGGPGVVVPNTYLQTTAVRAG